MSTPTLRAKTPVRLQQIRTEGDRAIYFGMSHAMAKQVRNDRKRMKAGRWFSGKRPQDERPPT